MVRSSYYKDICFCMANQAYLSFYYTKGGEPEVEIECDGIVLTAPSLGQAVWEMSKALTAQANGEPQQKELFPTTEE